ncbi:MAG TPA: type II toxin-antitoxin system prevent-host-death family antitoxin [Marinagarivorans sp.]
MEIINIAGLKSHLSEVIGKVSETGESVVIGRYGVPVARIVPFEAEPKVRTIGFAKHLLMSNAKTMQQQVDAPVDDETMNGFYP